MHVNVITLFPELFTTFSETSFVKKAIVTGALTLKLEPLREHGLGKHRSVDDTPYGGGAGMVLRVDCVAAAIESAEAGTRSHRVLLTPQGRRFVQPMARELVERAAVTLVCGRYEGFDERVRALVDEEISLGDFVLAGGEIPAMAVVEACIRLLPGVLGNEESASLESFSDDNAGLLEYPQYTRPATFRGEAVPDVLTSGDHARIEAWRRKAALEKTLARRPELVRDKGR
ncbi:MAG TPA: tRNA (guanosine(37)-N1)-methyltransferase TrmD [Polyangiaceae bacterium]|jgi:tRNA (guanine37-N1)-methyltransferase|nr:tRNA (guanosine(37)-N1)-methyltransferase TrmD [Polyangiaceae bacterium]